jgi:membrane protease subunit (stomatin/prohibitin family)
MKCPECQTENADSAKFCTACGQQLQTETVCPQCSHINRPTAKFCEECGYVLVQLAPATAPPSSEPASFANGRYQVKKFLGEGVRRP